MTLARSSTRLLALGPLLAAIAWVSAGTARAAQQDRDLSSRAQAYQLYAQAQMLLLDRKEPAAIELLEQAIERDPNPSLMLETARAHDAVGQEARALDLVRRALEMRPGWAEAHSLEGDIHLNRARAGEEVLENVDRALDAYGAAVRADPTNAATVRTLAELSMEVGRLEEAAAVLTAYAERQHLGPALSLLLARVHLRARQPEKAEPLLVALVERSPTSLDAVDTLAGLYEADERYDDAIALYEPVLRAGINSSGIQDRLGLLHLEAGHGEEAVDHLEEARQMDPDDTRRLLPLAQAQEMVGNFEAAMQDCEAARAADPESLEAMFHHARLRRKQGDAPGARREFESLLRMAETREKLTEREAAIVRLSGAQVGVLALEVHDYDAAADAFALAAQGVGGERPDILFLLARAQMQSGKLDAADRTAAEALDRFPDALDIGALRGEILLARGDDIAARAYFKALVEREKGSVDVFVNIAETWMRRRRYADAEQIVSEGLRRHKDDDRLLFARGAAQERLGRTAQAEQSLARAVEVNPKNAMALNYLGYMLAESGRRLNDSLVYVERALALEPNNPAYLDSLGWALFKLERFEPAERNLRAALRYDGADPSIREHLGDLLVATGRTKEAVQEWEVALACGHEEPERIKEKLARAQEKLQPRP